MWNEFHDKMEQIFGKSFRQVDDLYYDISKEVNFEEKRIWVLFHEGRCRLSEK